MWADLLSEEELLESPTWHKKVLQDTENRLAEGKERIVDWHTAKKLGIDHRVVGGALKVGTAFDAVHGGYEAAVSI